MLWKLSVFSVMALVAMIVICEKIAKKKRSTERALRAVVFGTALPILAWWVFYWSSPERETGSYEVDYSLLNKYTEDQFPRFFEQWGKDGVLRIEASDRAALEKVTKQKKCDSIDYVGLAERESIPPETIVSFANCSNGYQFYVGPDGQIIRYRKIK